MGVAFGDGNTTPRIGEVGVKDCSVTVKFIVSSSVDSFFVVLLGDVSTARWMKPCLLACVYWRKEVFRKVVINRCRE